METGLRAGSDVHKVVQIVVITDTSSTEPRHIGTHCIWAIGCDKAAQVSKVSFVKHKFSGHTAPIRIGQTGNLNTSPPPPPPASVEKVGGGN